MNARARFAQNPSDVFTADELMAAQAAFDHNPADTAAMDAVMDAIGSVEDANQADAQARLAYQSNQKTLMEAQTKLDGLRRQTTARVQDQVKREIAQLRRKQEGMGAAPAQRTIFHRMMNEMAASAKAEEKVGPGAETTSGADLPNFPNVSIAENNAGNEAAPLASVYGSGIIGEGTPGEAGNGAGLAENPDGQANAANTDKLLKKSTCSFDDLYRYLNRINGDLAYAYAKTGKWPSHVQIPKGPYVLNADGSINWDEVPEGGYVLDENGDAMKEIYTPDLNEIIDRYGPPNGRYTSPIINEPFSYDQRSLPFVEDPYVYHRYKVTGDFGNIERYFELSTNEELKREISVYMKKFKLSFGDLVIYRGKIAGGFGSVGGGIQYELPLPVYMLEGLRLISAI